MKTWAAFLLIISLLAGCMTPAARPKYSALIRNKTVQSELAVLEEQRLPRIDVDDVSLITLLSQLEPTCSEVPDGSLKIIDPKNEIAGLRVSLHRSDLSIPEVYDLLCQQADLAWWVDKYIYISKK